MTEPDALRPAEIRSRAASGVVAFAFRGVTVRGMGFVSTVVLARYLAPSQLGIVALASTVLVFAQILANGGFASGLIRRKEEPDRASVAAMQAFQLGLTIAVAAPVIAIGVPLGGAGALAAFMVLALPISVLRVPLVVHGQRRLMYDQLARAEIVEGAAYSLLTIALVVGGLGIWSIAIATVARAFVGLWVLRRSIGVPIVGPRWNWGLVRPMLGFGFSFQALDLSNALRDYGTNIIIAGVAGSTVLGFWSLTSRVMLVVTMLFSSLYRVSFTAMSRLLATDEPVDGTLRRAFGLTATAIALLAAPLVGSAPALIPVVFGERWSPVAEVVPWVAAGLLLSGPVSTAATGYILALGDGRTIVRNVLLHTAAFFVAMTPLLPSMGVQAVGVGFLAMALTDVVLLSAVVRRNTPVDALRITLPVAVVALAAGGVGWLAATSIGVNVVGAIGGAAVAELLLISVLRVMGRGSLADLTGVLSRALQPRLRPLRRAGAG
jgi:O-antigen/teichoic acid export membrane protein